MNQLNREPTVDQTPAVPVPFCRRVHKPQPAAAEGGASLSGGQRQRLSLARACYRDADIYLMDDVLSALDAKVGAQVFEKVLSRQTGSLRDKTVLLVTHAHWTFPLADQMLVIREVGC